MARADEGLALLVADHLPQRIEDRRVDAAGMHRVAADAVFLLGAVERHALAEQPHRALAGGIGGRSGRADQAGDRGDVDDRALGRGLSGPVFFMPSMAYLQPRNTPSELIAWTCCQFSTVVVSGLPLPPEMPALLTMMSRRPSFAARRPAATCHDCSEATSCDDEAAGPSLARWRSARMTRAPWPASSAAEAAPMPERRR